MDTLTMNSPALSAATPSRPRARALGALLIADALLAFAPVVVLGAAIGWPASLDRPPAEQLAAIAAAPDAVALGYGLYLLYSVLVAPLMIGLAARLHGGGLAHPLAATVAAFGVLSALARSVGILRWLTVMPELAQAHATADAATRSQIELAFATTTAYGGGIGELLGVSLFMAFAVGLLGAAAWRQRSLPRPLAGAAVAVALMLGSLFLPALRIDAAAPMAVAVSALSLWMLATGAWLMRRAR